MRSFGLGVYTFVTRPKWQGSEGVYRFAKFWSGGIHFCNPAKVPRFGRKPGKNIFFPVRGYTVLGNFCVGVYSFGKCKKVGVYSFVKFLSGGIQLCDVFVGVYTFEKFLCGGIHF